MSSLKAHDKVIFEKLFDRGGYVLDFTDRTYAEFFREHGIDISAKKYQFNGASKMKRLRAFWEIEPDAVVAKVLAAMLEYAGAMEKLDAGDRDKAGAIINRLAGKPAEAAASSQEDFLRQVFADLNLARLNVDGQLQAVIEQRIDEIHKSLNAKASLAAIFLCGSTLEGLLLDAATSSPNNSTMPSRRPKTRTIK